MKNIAILLIITVFISCAQNKHETNDIRQKTLLADSVVNKSFIASNGERFLRFELVIHKSIEDTWKLFSTEEGMKSWMAPVVTLDLRVGGMARTNYDSTAKIGDKGTIPLPILNYIPNELITYKVELNEVFAQKCRDEDQNLQEIVKLESIGPDKTKVISTMIGWGEGKEWDQTYVFFEKGNKWTYEQLLNHY